MPRRMLGKLETAETTKAYWSVAGPGEEGWGRAVCRSLRQKQRSKEYPSLSLLLPSLLLPAPLIGQTTLEPASREPLDYSTRSSF